nr:hypothetical protein [Tanacetum cinerariifolium]
RDDALFSTIKVVSRHQATQQYGAILPVELTSAEIRKKSNVDSDEGSDKDSDETVKSGAGKEDDDDDDEEEETAKDDEEDKETGKGGNE